jgi:hypothetical protein
MPGGLLQLVGVGSQDQFVTGNPSMTYFTTMYKRFTNFAMEHFRIDFLGNDLNLPIIGTKTIKCKVPRYADMLHDLYVCVNIPDIYSPISIDSNGTSSTGTPYEFQWIKNLGYNMIQEASILINGSPIVTMTGEWMKLISYLKYDKTKRAIIDQMVGNTSDFYDPANVGNRKRQYPSAVQTSPPTSPQNPVAPSIRGRQLNIPLPFWFCENIGQSLPLVALTEGEVEISITFRNLYQLFTTIDVRNINPNSPSTYGTRTPGLPGDNNLGLQNFLSAPDFFGFPINLSLQNWNLNPYIEANYVFLTDTERAHVAGYDRTYIITQPRLVPLKNEYGYNDTLIPMFNLCTRIIAVFQRSDSALLNKWDNYTNWSDSTIAPLSQAAGNTGPLQFYTSGIVNPNAPLDPVILQEATLVLDGKERFPKKNSNFFNLIENFKYSSGETFDLPGIYQYSFSLEPNNMIQPSGSLNGSMFNKTRLQYTLQVPAVDQEAVAASEANNPPVCVVKSTVFNPVPTPVPANATVPPGPGLPPLFQANQTISIYSAPTNNGMAFQYNGIIYVESYNFLKVTGGTANVIFST